MCRIAYSPSHSLIFNDEDLWGFFNRLETVGGKDGNGVYLTKSEQIAKSAFIMPNWITVREGFLFHTRRATHGHVADYNTQPFVGKRYVMVHNGICTEAKTTAMALGLQNIDKWSDSYHMFYIIEKVGILNFYMAFAPERFGVILVWDKVLKQMFLLKSGSFDFQFAKIDGKYIYGSSQLDYWVLDKWEGEKKKVWSFKEGLYRLREDGIDLLHRYEFNYASHYAQYYGNYGSSSTYSEKKNTTTASTGGTTTKTTGEADDTTVKTRKAKHKRNKRIQKGRKKSKKQKLKDKEAKEQMETDSDSTPIGIANLFPMGEIYSDEEVGEIKRRVLDDLKPKGRHNYIGLVPAECAGCDWNRNKGCWFNNVLQDSFNFRVDKDTGFASCNTTENGTDSRKDLCDYCGLPIGNIAHYHSGKIYCHDCSQKEKKSKKIIVVGSDGREYYSDSNEVKCYWCGLHFEENDIVYRDDEEHLRCDECYDFDRDENRVYTKEFFTYPTNWWGEYR